MEKWTHETAGSLLVKIYKHVLFDDHILTDTNVCYINSPESEVQLDEHWDSFSSTDSVILLTVFNFRLQQLKLYVWRNQWFALYIHFLKELKTEEWWTERRKMPLGQV